MVDPPGVPSALGIDAVEWSAEGDQITIRVGGRWRRRRPSLGGQPVLVLEAHGARHRFPAMPEPPSLSGASPGTWWLSFSLPASLAPELSGRLWLQFGAVVVPLPAPVKRPAGEHLAGAGGPGQLDPEMLVQRQLRGSEIALQDARRRAAEAEQAGQELSARIRQLEDRVAHLTALLAEHEAQRRAAEQRAYAEQALRAELEEQLGHRERGSSVDADTFQRRAEELESELALLHRRLDEAEHASAAAEAGRARAERAATEVAWALAERCRLPDLRAEFATASARAPGFPHQGQRPRPPAFDAVLVRGEQLMLAGWSAAAGIRRSEPGPTVAAQVQATLSELRDELERLRTLSERERAARAEAQARAGSLERRLRVEIGRAARAHQAIGDVRGRLDALRTTQPREQPAEQAHDEADVRPAAPDPSGPVESERLAAALARLRVQTPPGGVGDLDSDAGAGELRTPPAKPRAWLAKVFKSLTEQDSMTAGRFLLQLLPAQHAVHPQPLAYDLILGELAVVQVTVQDGPPRIDFVDAARAPGEVRFQVAGDLAAIARTVVASRVRRRLGRGLARITGDRRAFASLVELIRQPLTLSELYAAGVRLDPPLALTVAALMIDSGATRGQLFTIAHQAAGSPTPDAFLRVADRKPSVTEAPPPDPAGTTIVCDPDTLLMVLDGAPTPDALVRGDRRPLELLQRWIQDAQGS